MQATGPADSAVGILRFLRSDSWVGSYRATGGGNDFVLDFGRCMQPDLPCKDVAESGAQVGNNFLPVKSVGWRLEDDHARDSSGALSFSPRLGLRGIAPVDGAPGDLAIDKAMAGRTCRFMARRLGEFCKPELT